VDRRKRGDPWSGAGNGTSWNASANAQNWTTPGGDFDRTTDFGNGPNGLITSQTLNGYNAANDLIEFDVTAVVNAWTDGKSQNHGLAFVITQGQYTEYLFASSEAVDEDARPTLVIEQLQ
jgi:hypothetical protein